MQCLFAHICHNLIGQPFKTFIPTDRIISTNLITVQIGFATILRKSGFDSIKINYLTYKISKHPFLCSPYFMLLFTWAIMSNHVHFTKFCIKQMSAWQQRTLFWWLPSMSSFYTIGSRKHIKTFLNLLHEIKIMQICDHFVILHADYNCFNSHILSALACCCYRIVCRFIF